jgi:predicted kinase
MPKCILRGVLIIFAGLPGTGKTTIARELARQTHAVYVRIDTIERAIDESGIAGRDMSDAGYRVAYAVCEDNLRLGRTVVADSVNPLRITRDAWMDAARRAGSPAINIEIVCSDPVEHRRRVETRPGEAEWRPPAWDDVVARRYEEWDRERTTIDTSRTGVDAAVSAIRSALAGERPDDRATGKSY